MPTKSRSNETFAVVDGCLVRRVDSQRGNINESRCPLEIYRELIWAAVDLTADGFTVETLVDRVRSRPCEAYDDRESSASLANAATAVGFWKDRRLLRVHRGRTHLDDGYFFEDATIELRALAESG